MAGGKKAAPEKRQEALDLAKRLTTATGGVEFIVDKEARIFSNSSLSTMRPDHYAAIDALAEQGIISCFLNGPVLGTKETAGDHIGITVLDADRLATKKRSTKPLSTIQSGEIGHKLPDKTKGNGGVQL